MIFAFRASDFKRNALGRKSIRKGEREFAFCLNGWFCPIIFRVVSIARKEKIFSELLICFLINILFNGKIQITFAGRNFIKCVVPLDAKLRVVIPA